MSSPCAEIHVIDSENCIDASEGTNATARPAATTVAAPATAAETTRTAVSPRTNASAAAPAAGSQTRIDSQGRLSMEHEPEEEVSEDRGRARGHRSAGQADHAGVDPLHRPISPVREPAGSPDE